MEEKLILIGRKPRKVFQDGCIEYFYWRWDAYKPFDYEPVMICGENNENVVISRFHWKIATVWFNAVLSDKKPKTTFVKAVHTPLIQSSKYDRSLVLKLENKSLYERLEIDCLSSIFEGQIKKGNKLFDGNSVSYSDILVQESVPEKYRFVLGKIDSMVIIGDFSPNILPPQLKKLINLK